MSRVTTSITLDPEDRDWFQENFPEVSLSALTEQVIKEMRETGKRPDGIEFKREMLDRELKMHESQIERIRMQLDRVEEVMEERQSVEEAAEERAVEQASNRNSYVDETNPAVQNQAAKVGISPAEFAKLMNQHIEPDTSLRATTDGGRD